jgi:GNAT superfamily N-acetyltransferase
VAELLTSWLNEDNTWGLELADRGELKSWLTDLAYVFVADGRVLGLVRATIHESGDMAWQPRPRSFAELSDLYVAPSERRKGIGEALVQEVLSAAAEAGIGDVHVFSAAQDQHAIMRFYKRLGFVPWGVQFFRSDTA